MSRTLVLFGLLISACGTRHGADPSPTSTAEQNGADAAAPRPMLAIGAACKAEDGYVPGDRCGDAGASASAPTNCAPGGAAPGGQFTDLPPHVGYCLRAQEFPDGYFTMNCATDADCPGGSRCGSKLCWAPCSSDGDCRAPSTCPADGSSLRICRCTTCLGGGQGS
jgi:hypothetical protein